MLTFDNIAIFLITFLERESLSAVLQKGFRLLYTFLGM